MAQQERESRQRRDAALARELLGPAELDALLGAQSPDEAVTLLLANHPVVTGQNVQDGIELLAAQREWPADETEPRGSRWLFRSDAAQARHALRWAAGRPGQLQRGLPMVSPLDGVGFPPRIVAVLSWILAPIALLVLWIVLEGGPDVLVPWGVFILMVLHGAWWFRRGQQLDRAAEVSQEHLFLLRHRKHGLPVDAVTALTEQFLEVHAAPFRVTSVREWTAYPVSRALPEEEVARRIAALRVTARSRNLEVPEGLERAPLVHSQWAEKGEHTPTGGRFEEDYAGGWLVAEATVEWDHGPAWLIVRDHPERFADVVLPLFGDLHGFLEGSVRLVDPPERVPSGHRWIDEWVKARRG